LEDLLIKIGIIGAGPNAAGHATYYHASPRARVVAVADPAGERAAALAEQCDAKAIPDFHDFLDQVDAVVVSSPNFLHRDHAIACAAAGRHLFCEKPVGLNLGEAREIAAAVDEAGVKSMVGFSVRFTDTLQTMQRIVRAGDIGEIVGLCSRRLAYFPPGSGPGWRLDHARSGGILLEVSIHELDWIMALGGDIDSVYARTWAAEPGPRSNDQIWVTMNFKAGAVGYHEGSWSSATANYYRSVQGTRGGLCTDEWGSTVFHAPMGADRVAVDRDPTFDLRGNFLDCIEHGAVPVADIHWGVKVMAVAEAVYESARSGTVAKVMS
jgi:predicted dehydrogenase